jgi:AraC-like DNA-binding protein
MPIWLFYVIWRLFYVKSSKGRTKPRERMPLAEAQIPSSAVRTFTDPDEYAEGIRGRAELTVTGRGQFRAKLVRIDLHELWMQQHSDNISRITYSPKLTSRNVISFRIQPGPSLLLAGIETQLSAIVRHGGDADGFYQRSSGLADFGSMSLPIDNIVALSAVAGCDLMAPRDTRSFAPRPSAMARLQRLHATAASLATEVPGIIRNPAAARGLQQALIDAMVDCLSIGALEEDMAAKRHHRAIIRRFRAAIEDNPDQPIFLSQLCSSIGVTERTLLRCCQEQLGVSPKRFLLLRRMHMVRRALREAEPHTATVTAVATRYGFWELGRFAAVYGALFGERPSTTLRRPADYPPKSVADLPEILSEIA